MHTCSGGSCKQPHSGSQTYIGLLVPAHIICCGTNHKRWIKIYNLCLGITNSVHKTHWTSTSCGRPQGPLPLPSVRRYLPFGKTSPSLWTSFVDHPIVYYFSTVPIAHNGFYCPVSKCRFLNLHRIDWIAIAITHDEDLKWFNKANTVRWYAS